MDSGYTTFALYGLGAAALTASLATLKTRLELSRAKHRSLSGHARMARRIAALIPFYEYDDERFFRSDDPPEEIAARRRAGFMRLSTLYRERFAQTARRTAEHPGGHLRPAIHRRLPGAVPVQPPRAPAPRRRRVRPVVLRRDPDRPGRQSLLRSDRLVRREPARLRLLQGLPGTRLSARARPRPGARPLSSGDRLQRPAAARDFRARRGVVSHVRHRGGHAGGAARALPHPPISPRAFLRRLSWLVGRRAAGRRQPGAGARYLHAEGHVRGYAAGAAHAPRHRLRAGQSAAGAASEHGRRRRLRAGR